MVCCKASWLFPQKVGFIREDSGDFRMDSSFVTQRRAGRFRAADERILLLTPGYDRAMTQKLPIFGLVVDEQVLKEMPIIVPRTFGLNSRKRAEAYGSRAEGHSIG